MGAGRRAQLDDHARLAEGFLNQIFGEVSSAQQGMYGTPVSAWVCGDGQPVGLVEFDALSYSVSVTHHCANMLGSQKRWGIWH